MALLLGAPPYFILVYIYIYISNLFSKFGLIRKEVAGKSVFSDAIFLGHIGSDPHLMSHEQHSHHGGEIEKNIISAVISP